LISANRLNILQNVAAEWKRAVFTTIWIIWKRYWHKRSILFWI